MPARTERVVLLERADADIRAALAWYRVEAPAAADGFLVALERATGHIRRAPASGSPRYAHALNLPGLRFRPCSRYPYLVFYMEHAERIDVWRVLHSHRDIPAWLQEPDAPS